MKEIQTLSLYLKAGYSFFYIHTEELNKTSKEIVNFANEYTNGGGAKPYTPFLWDFAAEPNPEVVMDTLGSESGCNFVVAKNWQWFLVDEYDKPEKSVCSFLIKNADLFNTVDNRRILVIVGNEGFETAIPKILQREFLNLSFSLPSKEDIGESLLQMIHDAKDNPKFVMPELEEQQRIVNSASGMTQKEVNNALAYSLIKTGGTIDPVLISELKAKEVEKTAGLKIGKYSVKLGDLKGYNNVKNFVLNTIKSMLSKGIMLLGPPGTGKTTFARAIGSYVKMIVFELELAELFGGLVGDTEKLVKTAIEVITANAPCIVFVDEIEKGLAGSGSGSSGSTDGGTTKRAMAQFLKFLSDKRPEGVYVIATCNDITSLDPEWIRAGRWDSAPFFIDLPTATEKKEIWKHYKEVYSIDKFIKKPAGTSKGQQMAVQQFPVDDEGWSGAEIESCCRIASMMGTSLKEAKQFIVPVSMTMEEKIVGLRKWAKKRTVPATVEIKAAKAEVRSIDM